MSQKYWILGLLGFLATASFFFFTNPIPQDPNYHLFSDDIPYFSIANFWNVLSNAPFLLVGLWGVYCLRKDQLAVIKTQAQAYYIFFIGVALVAIGSGYYHLNPNNQTLIWDRLPMTIAFMALCSILIGEFFSEQAAKKALYPLLLIGGLSIAYWVYTESLGQGDLRFYGLVQFIPMIAVPLVISLKQSPYNSVKGYWWLLAYYVIAKIAEYFDHSIHQTLSFMSGHSLKHIFAAIGIAYLVQYYRKRSPINQ